MNMRNNTAVLALTNPRGKYILNLNWGNLHEMCAMLFMLPALSVID